MTFQINVIRFLGAEHFVVLTKRKNHHYFTNAMAFQHHQGTFKRSKWKKLAIIKSSLLRTSMLS